MKRTLRLLALTLLGATLTAQAEVKTKTVEYRDGDTVLRGYMAWDDAKKGPRPGILVVHEWWGLNAFAQNQARRLAQLGYVAFAADMYGKGQTTTHPSEAQAWSKQITANIEGWQRRGLRALEAMRQQPQIDGNQVAALGYCFGGATVMQLAYAGADLKGVVSLHGSLPVATPEQARTIKGQILAHHGAADSFTPWERVRQFQSALEQAGVDWRMVIHGGARHAFTNPDADSYGIENLKYDPKAARRSWADLQLFFKELFPDPRP